MPLGRFQRALDAAQERFGGPPMASDEPVRLGNVVTYVVLLGSDRTDRERVSFGWGLEQVGVAARFCSVVLEALQDLEVEMAFMSRAGGALDANAQFLSAPPAGYVLELDQTIQRSDEAGPGARVHTGTDALVTAGVSSSAPAQTTLSLWPPLILPAGRCLQLLCENVNTNVRAGFFWRALG